MLSALRNFFKKNYGLSKTTFTNIYKTIHHTNRLILNRCLMTIFFQYCHYGTRYGSCDYE